MECRHCGEKFTERQPFKDHLVNHDKIQGKVFAGRSYGAVYRKGQPRVMGTASPSTIEQQQRHPTVHAQAKTEKEQPDHYICRFCGAMFSNFQLGRDHEESSDCIGHTIVCWVLIIDSYEPSGYRVEERCLVPPKTSWLYLCGKCELAYATEQDREHHSRTHQKENLSCEHCRKQFDTLHELNVHYDWHYDIQMDYNIENAQISSQTDKDTAKDVAEFSDNRVYIPSTRPSIILSKSKVRRDGEVVALSFVSGSDVKTLFTSLTTGKFHEASFSGSAPPPTIGFDAEATAPRKGEAFDKLMDYLDPTPYTTSLQPRLKIKPRKDWYFDCKEIKNWLDPQFSEGPYLLIQGPIGCGKTVSAAHIIEHCLHVYGRSQSLKGFAVISFFFGDVIDHNNLTRLFLTTVIAQLYARRPQLSVRIPLLDIPLIDGIPLDYLWTTLGDLLLCFECTYCILDGVDFPERRTFLHNMEQLFIDRNIRTLVTSRSHPGKLASKPGWIEIDVPLEIVCENVRSYAMSEINRLQLSAPSSENYAGHDIILRNRHESFYYIIVATKAISKLLNSAQDLDGLLEYRFWQLKQEDPYLRDNSFRILQWMICTPISLTVADLEELLFMGGASETRMPVIEIIRTCLQGLVDEIDGYARFSVPPVRDYIVTGTTYLNRESTQNKPIIPLNQAYRNIVIEILNYLNSSGFSQYVSQRPPVNSTPSRWAARHLILRSRWLWFLTQAEPDIEIIISLTKFLQSTICRVWIQDFAREEPCLLLRQLYDVELEKLLQKSRNVTESKQTQSHLTHLREISFEIFKLSLPLDPTELVKTVNCLGQLLISSQFPAMAEDLFRRLLRITSFWQAEPEIVHKHLPFYILGHTIEEGQLLTVKDISGRAKALSGSTLGYLITQAQFLSDSKPVRRRILNIFERMRKLARQGLHKEVHALHQKVKAQLEPIRWDNSTIISTVLGLAALLFEQGRSSEVDAFLHGSDFDIEEDGPLILISCSAGKTKTKEEILASVNRSVNGAGAGRAASPIIERLGRFYFNTGYETLARLFFEEAFAQREARQENIKDPATFESFKLLTSSFLATADFEAVHAALTKIGSLSLPQLRELSQVNNPIVGMNFAILFQQLGLNSLVTRVVEDLTATLDRVYSERDEPDGTRKRVSSTVIFNLAAFITKQNRVAEAEILLRRVLADPHDLSQRQLLAVKHNLAATLHRLGNRKDAETLDREIRTSSQTLGSSTNLERDRVFQLS